MSNRNIGIDLRNVMKFTDEELAANYPPAVYMPSDLPVALYSDKDTRADIAERELRHKLSGEQLCEKGHMKDAQLGYNNHIIS